MRKKFLYEYTYDTESFSDEFQEELEKLGPTEALQLFDKALRKVLSDNMGEVAYSDLRLVKLVIGENE